MDDSARALASAATPVERDDIVVDTSSYSSHPGANSSASIPVVSAPLIPLHHGSAETCECEAVGALRDASRGLDSDIEMENGTGELRAVEGGARVGGSSVRDGLPPSVTADLARGGSEVDTTQTGGQNEARPHETTLQASELTPHGGWEPLLEDKGTIAWHDYGTTTTQEFLPAHTTANQLHHTYSTLLDPATGEVITTCAEPWNISEALDGICKSPRVNQTNERPDAGSVHVLFITVLNEAGVIRFSNHIYEVTPDALAILFGSNLFYPYFEQRLDGTRQAMHFFVEERFDSTMQPLLGYSDNIIAHLRSLDRWNEATCYAGRCFSWTLTVPLPGAGISHDKTSLMSLKNKVIATLETSANFSRPAYALGRLPLVKQGSSATLDPGKETVSSEFMQVTFLDARSQRAMDMVSDHENTHRQLHAAGRVIKYLPERPQVELEEKDRLQIAARKVHACKIALEDRTRDRHVPSTSSLLNTPSSIPPVVRVGLSVGEGDVVFFPAVSNRRSEAVQKWQSTLPKQGDHIVVCCCKCRATKVVKDVSAYQGSHNTYTHPSPVSTICPVDLTLGPSASYEIISDPTAPIPDLAARYQRTAVKVLRDGTTEVSLVSLPALFFISLGGITISGKDFLLRWTEFLEDPKFTQHPDLRYQQSLLTHQNMTLMSRFKAEYGGAYLREIESKKFEDGGVIVSGDWKSFWTNYGNPDGLAEFECRVVALVEEIKASFPSAQPSTKKQTWIIPAPQGRLDSRTSEESGGVRIQFLVGSLKAIVAADVGALRDSHFGIVSAALGLNKSSVQFWYTDYVQYSKWENNLEDREIKTMQKELEGLDWNGERLGSKFTYDDQEVPISGNDKFLHIDDLADPGRAWDLIKKAELALKTTAVNPRRARFAQALGIVFSSWVKIRGLRTRPDPRSASSASPIRTLPRTNTKTAIKKSQASQPPSTTKTSKKRKISNKRKKNRASDTDSASDDEGTTREAPLSRSKKSKVSSQVTADRSYDPASAGDSEALGKETAPTLCHDCKEVVKEADAVGCDATTCGERCFHASCAGPVALELDWFCSRPGCSGSTYEVLSLETPTFDPLATPNRTSDPTVESLSLTTSSDVSVAPGASSSRDESDPTLSTSTEHVPTKSPPSPAPISSSQNDLSTPSLSSIGPPLGQVSASASSRPIDRSTSDGGASLETLRRLYLRAATHNAECLKLDKIVRDRSSSQYIIILDALLEDLPFLSSHSSGNYLVQSLIRRCDSDDLDRVIDVLYDSFVELSQNSYGTRIVQLILTNGTTDQVVSIICALRGEIPACSTNRFANYVFQIALDRLPEWCVAEIARELSPCINVVGTNVGGSVVLQKLVLLLKDDGDAGYRREFLSGIAKATSILIFDKYGSRVVESAIEGGHDDTFRPYLSAFIRSHLATLATDAYGHCVVRKYVAVAEPSELDTIVRNLTPEEIRASMANIQGVSVMKDLLSTLDRARHQDFFRRVREEVAVMSVWNSVDLRRVCFLVGL